ncbi:hypothetical protein M0R45_006382 [Rubus argutus]|uniref:Uncharacterized protein n=1 Tax=Rubus argutus TaxID=59490 RepID=A0AAW1YQA0_RUBAR
MGPTAFLHKLQGHERDRRHEELRAAGRQAWLTTEDDAGEGFRGLGTFDAVRKDDGVVAVRTAAHDGGDAVGLGRLTAIWAVVRRRQSGTMASGWASLRRNRFYHGLERQRGRSVSEWAEATASWRRGCDGWARVKIAIVITSWSVEERRRQRE